MMETITPAVSPAFEHIIERPRLIARLEEGGGARVTVLAAPAGYGKTTLARQWSERQSRPVPWYRTTRASGDVALLAVQLDELLASVEPALPAEPHKVAAIAAVNPSPEPLARAIVRSFAALTKDVLLVVDEWEAAGTDEAEELLSMLVDGLDIRFLITSRARPEWFTRRLEVYGEGLEIGKDELAMTEEEAADVLFYVRNRGVSKDVRALAEGWPAVLGLAAMHARTGSRTEPAILLPDALYEYLATELIDAVEPGVRHAVTVTALTAAPDLETARLLLGTGADRALAAAHERGLTTIDKGRRISIHPLLRRVLLERVESDPEPRRRYGPTLERILEHRLWNEAQAVADVVPLPEFVTNALERALPDLLREGRLTTIRKWIEIGRAANAPLGLLDYAESELALRSGEALKAYGLALQAAQSLEGELASRAHLVAGRAAHLTDRPGSTEHHADSAAALAETQESREGALWLRFLAALERQTPDLRERLEEYKAIAQPGVTESLMKAAGELCLAQIEGGLAKALDDARAALALVREETDAIAHTGLLSTYSYALIMTSRYGDGLKSIEALESVAESCGLEFPRRYAQIYRARAYVGLRRVRLAERTLSMLERQTQGESGGYFRANLPVQRARLYATLGDLKRALEVLALGPAPNCSRAARGEFIGWQALMHAAAGALEDAEALAAEACLPDGGLEGAALASIAQAILALSSNDSDVAAELIDQAIASEVWDPIVIALRAAPDLARFVAQGERRVWLQRLLVASSDGSLAASLGLRVPRAAKPQERLSPRETEVHELLAQGLTNEEIARLLYISLSTTKVHVKHIFEKLAVRSRLEAARAFRGDD
jgi:LuxR family maltose regulon positive regulatory protein